MHLKWKLLKINLLFFEIAHHKVPSPAPAQIAGQQPYELGTTPCYPSQWMRQESLTGPAEQKGHLWGQINLPYV